MKAPDSIPLPIRSLVFAQAAGNYQRNLLRGIEPWSGAGLQGKARTHGASYARSRESLVVQINQALREVRRGWRAETRLVRVPGAHRKTHELILIGPRGGEYVW